MTPKKDGWTPCSERLPEKNGFYLCTTKDCITILEFTDGNPHYHEKPSFVSDVLGKCNSYVIAWMPLPERYNIDEPDDLPEETAIGYVKRLKESGIKPGEVLELWNDEW